MSKSTLDTASFLPFTAPKTAVNDYSGELSSSELSRLNAQISHMQGVKAKVVVLPKTFHADDFPQFSRDLAAQWHVKGDRVLMVISLKDHQVRVLPGKQLHNEGLTAQVISDDILPGNFIPYIKRHDLFGAISHTATAIETRVGQLTTASDGDANARTSAAPSSAASGGVVPSTSAPITSNDAGAAAWVMVWVVGLVVVAGMIGLSFWSRKNDNKRLKEAFDKQVNALYVSADQIGQASEYLETTKQPELAQRIATFFNRLSTLQEAVNDVQRLEKQNKVWQVRDAYMNLGRMVSILEPEAKSLKEDLDAATGGVNSLPDTSAAKDLRQLAAEKPRSDTDDGERIRIPDRIEREMQYTRPSWTYQPAYYQPVDSGLGGLGSMMLIMNQMEMMHRMGQLEEAQRNGGYFHHNSSDGGWNSSAQSDYNSNSTWGSGSSNSDGGASWGDSGGSNFDDGGAGWGDSGGGDFGGGADGGGDW